MYLRNPIACITIPTIMDRIPITCCSVAAFPHYPGDAQNEAKMESLAWKAYPATRKRNPMTIMVISRNRIEERMPRGIVLS
jgi:hypothetical protein